MGLEGNAAPCPQQSNPNYFQRTNCMEPSNQNILELFSRFQNQAQSTSFEMAKFVLPSPYVPNQKARFYLNTQTGECFYIHQGGKPKILSFDEELPTPLQIDDIVVFRHR